jgi:MFS family permease
MGMWMRDVAGAWLMTSLAPTPIMVALMQTATSLPMFLLSMPAGALADVVDRRRLLIFNQVWIMAVAALIGGLTLAGVITPVLLLLFTFVLQIGGAMTVPAYQAVVPELVPRADLHSAVTLGAMGFNISRAAGPALGGLIVALLGPAPVFFISAATFVGVLAVLYRWHREAPESALPTERVFAAMRTGLRYVLHAPEIHAPLVRALIFIFCGSAVWALLPLLVKQEMGLGSSGFGLFLGCLGAGAVAAAFILPAIRQRFSADVIVNAAQVLFAAVLVSIGGFHHPVFVGFAMAVGGVAWISIFSTCNAEMQTSVPSWVRGRVMAMFGIVFFGGMAAGSSLWGAVASLTGIPATLVCAGLVLGSGLALAVRYRFRSSEGLDLRPSMHWSQQELVIEPELDQGPVLVSIEYRVEPVRAREFTRAMRALRRIRLRTGAFEWGLFRDTKDERRFVEYFLANSWLEHLRQHERFTVADHEINKIARSFHVGDSPPVVSHMLYAYRLKEEPEQPA